jgi:protein-disulfide isomerase
MNRMKRPVGAVILALALATLAGRVPAAAAPSAADQAVTAYIKKQDADAALARDQYVANNLPGLLEDSASPVIGNPKANVWIVEFFDYACPYCKAVEPRLEALIRADKNVKLVVKEFPILTPQSMTAARIGLAAAKQGKYAAYHNALMNYRGQLDDEAIQDAAKGAHLDMARVKADINSPEVTNELLANFNLARSMRLFQTPSFIVAGHILTGESAAIDFPKLVAAARGK